MVKNKPISLSLFFWSQNLSCIVRKPTSIHPISFLTQVTVIMKLGIGILVSYDTSGYSAVPVDWLPGVLHAVHSGPIFCLILALVEGDHTHTHIGSKCVCYSSLWCRHPLVWVTCPWLAIVLERKLKNNKARFSSEVNSYAFFMKSYKNPEMLFNDMDHKCL